MSQSQRKLTPDVIDRPPTVLRRQQSVPSCYNASAAQRLLLAASYIFLVTFSVLYYAFLLLYLLVFP